MNVTNFLPTLPLEEFSFFKKVIFNDKKTGNINLLIYDHNVAIFHSELLEE